MHIHKYIYDCIFGKIDLNCTSGTKMLILDLNVWALFSKLMINPGSQADERCTGGRFCFGSDKNFLHGLALKGHQWPETISIFPRAGIVSGRQKLVQYHKSSLDCKEKNCDILILETWDPWVTLPFSWRKAKKAYFFPLKKQSLQFNWISVHCALNWRPPP